MNAAESMYERLTLRGTRTELSMAQQLILIAVAGGLGSVARYGAGNLAHWILGRDYFWGTAFVNVIGCLAFGMIWTFAEEHGWLDFEQRTILLVGFMGAFTTFSTFIYETGALIDDSRFLLAALHVSGQVFSGLMFFYLGILAARMVY